MSTSSQIRLPHVVTNPLGDKLPSASKIVDKSGATMGQSIQRAVRAVFGKCRELTVMTGRPFSPDGHLVGSLGEVFAADALDLRLMKPSNRGFDAVDSLGQRVEIKATTRNSIALSAAGTDAERLVVVVFDDNGVGAIAYDGPSQVVWDAAGVPQANGQRQIALSTLQRLSSGSQSRLFED